MRAPRPRRVTDAPTDAADEVATTVDPLRISVILAHPADSAAPAEMVEAIARQTLPAEAWEIVLAAYGAPAEAPADDAEALPVLPNLRPLSGTSPSAAVARNRAAAAARAPLLAFIDPQAAPEPQWLAALCDAFASYGEATLAVAGRIRPRWGAPRPSWLPDELLPALGIVDLGDAAYALAPDEPTSAGNLAVRAAAFSASGGFAAPMLATVAADDGPALLRRLHDAGGECVYQPAAVVVTPVPADHLTQTWFRRRAAWLAAQDAAGATAPTPEALAARWWAVKQFLYQCPPAERTVRGLVLAQHDPERFARQVAAVHDSVSCLLGGFGEPDFD